MKDKIRKFQKMKEIAEKSRKQKKMKGNGRTMKDTRRKLTRFKEHLKDNARNYEKPCFCD